MHCETYCILADIGLATQTNGNATICNQSRTEFKDDSGHVLRMDKNTLQQAWQSPTRTKIANALKNGQRHGNCNDCWHEEDAGRLSMRQLSNKKFKSIVPISDQPQVFMLKPGNACNLSCRHCNPFVSSNWYRDYYKAVIQPTQNTTFREFVQSFNSIRDSFDKDNNLWQQLQQWNDKIVAYDLYGAEPLLIEPLLQTLRLSYKLGQSKNQIIHVNTNGTIWHDDFNEVFSSFRNVELGISIDAIGQQFEYMRHPAKWDIVLRNLERYQQLAEKNPSIELSVCITVSLLNFYNLPDYVKFFLNQGIECGVNILHRPEHLNVRIAPQHAKDKIVKRLEQAAGEIKEWKSKFQNLANFVQLSYNNSEVLFDEFWQFTNTYDTLRGERYQEIFPEFYEILTNE